MKLYEKYIQTIYPNRKIFFDSKSFMIYEIDNVNDLIIYDLFSESLKQFVNVLRFADFLQPKNLFCRVQIKTIHTETNLGLYSKMGFTIYKTDNENIYMGTTFENWYENTSKFFDNSDSDSVSLKEVD